VYKRSLGEVVADIEAAIKEMDVPAGVEIQTAAQAEEQRESFFWPALHWESGCAWSTW